MTYIALARALDGTSTPQSINTQDLLSPFDGKPLTYRYDGKQIVIRVNGSKVGLKVPWDKMVRR